MDSSSPAVKRRRAPKGGQAECTTPFLAHKSFTHSCGIGIPLERKSIATRALPLETCLRSG